MALPFINPVCYDGGPNSGNYSSAPHLYRKESETRVSSIGPAAPLRDRGYSFHYQSAPISFISPGYVTRFCMRHLQWPEIAAAARDRMCEDIHNSECASLQQLLAVYESLPRETI